MVSISLASLAGSVVGAGLFVNSVSAQNCPTIAPKHAPNVAPGYSANVVLNGLSAPRGLIFDSAGNLLIVEQGLKGVRIAKLSTDGCVASSKQLINDTTVSSCSTNAMYMMLI